MNIDLLARELTPLHGRRTPKPKDIVVFTSKDEANLMDTVQGTPFIDETTGLRSYAPLWEAIQTNPELKEVFISVAGMMRNNNGSLPEPLKKASLSFDKKLKPFKEENAGRDPFIDSIEQQGEGEDKKLIKMPAAFSDFLDELSPGGPPDINPKFKIKEYKGIHEFWRAVGTVGGFLVGGPIGAAIGNTLAHKATGKSWGKSFRSGLGAGAGGLGAALGGLGPGMIAGGMTSTATGGGSKAATGMTHAGMGLTALAALASGAGAGLAGAGGAGTTGAGTLGAAGTGAGAGTGAAGAGAGAGGMGSLFSGNTLPLLLATGVLGAKAHGQSRKDEARYREELRREREEHMRLSGFKSPFKQMRFRHERTGYQPSNEEINRGSTGRHFYDPTYEHYAGGGMYHPPGKGYVEGRGTGQSDQIDARLSDGEFVIPADVVSSLGDGSNKAGARQLDILLKNVRKQKISKGTGLPPKAMNPMQYMPKHRACGGVSYA